MTRRTAGFVFAVALLVAGCSGARHRKVAGPPPEYELPEGPDAGVAWLTVAPPKSPFAAGDAGLR